MTSELSPLELETLGNGVRLIALRALGDADAARDAAQETMTRVLEALRRGKVRDSERLPAFVRGVAQHVITDLLRARSRRRSLGDDVLDPAQRDPLEALIASERYACMKSALNELSPDDREILRLAFVDGLTPAQLAARLNEPAERVRKRKSRALQRLREQYFAILQRIEPGHVSPGRPTHVQRRGEAFASQRGES